jgi:hypothetical protein
MTTAAKWAKGTEGVGYILMANDVRKGYIEDHHHFGNQTQNALQHVAMTALGASYGAAFGSTAGAIIFGGIAGFLTDGAAIGVGARFGSWVGGIGGAWAGGYIGGKMADTANQ